MGADGIGKRIASLRKEKGVTQKQLAEFLNVTDKAVSRWESGVGNPDLDYLPQICDFFGVNLDYLIRGIKSKPETEPVAPTPVETPEVKEPVLEKKKLTKKAKVLIASIAAGVLVLVGTGVGIAIGVNESISSGKYSSALKMMESGDYSKAIETFQSLSSYRDSQSKTEVCYGLISINNSKDSGDYSLLKNGVNRIVNGKGVIDATYDGKGKVIKDNLAQFTAEISLLNPGIYEPSDPSFLKWNTLSVFYLNARTTLLLTAVWSV